jgi:hypothetical protein
MDYYNDIKVKYPEIVNIISPKNHSRNLVAYGEININDLDFVYGVAWMYQEHYCKSIKLLLPRFVKKHNSQWGDLQVYKINHEIIENFNLKKDDIFIFGLTDIILEEIDTKKLVSFLKKLKKKKCVIKIFSYTSLKINQDISRECMDFDYMYFKTNPTQVNTVEFIDVEDSSGDVLPFVEFVDSLIKDNSKTVLISLDINVKKINQIFKELSKSYKVSKELNNSQIVFHTCNEYISQKFDYIFCKLPDLTPINYIKYLYLKTDHMFIDEGSFDNLEKNKFKLNYDYTIEPKICVEDSIEYSSYDEIIEKIGNDNVIMATESYLKIEANNAIKELDLSNLSRLHYNIIRDYVKFKVERKLNFEYKTCQLTTPSSPVDRSKKLNSLSNKISSFNYRCEITCEIFKDYRIGIVIWDPLFSQCNINKSVLKNNIYVYQTTRGNWKYSKVN